jgi:hypothetical protein
VARSRRPLPAADEVRGDAEGAAEPPPWRGSSWSAIFRQQVTTLEKAPGEAGGRDDFHHESTRLEKRLHALGVAYAGGRCGRGGGCRGRPLTGGGAALGAPWP